MGADDVVVIVVERLFHRLADRLEAGEVDDRGAAEAAHRRFQRCLVANITFDEVDLSAGNRFDPLQ